MCVRPFCPHVCICLLFKWPSEIRVLILPELTALFIGGDDFGVSFCWHHTAGVAGGCGDGEGPHGPGQPCGCLGSSGPSPTRHSTLL